MARLTITLACGDYDRTRALADGRVTVEGADLTVLARSEMTAPTGPEAAAAGPENQVTP
jgi:hypothetical protein